jgi:hypothetical protein
MWRRTPVAAQRAVSAPERVSTPEQRLLLGALRHLGGAARGVVYDVPTTARPARQYGRVALLGSQQWNAFLGTREQVDQGELTILVALRRLDDDEARIVVDWGSTYANTFLLVEPSEPGCDLVDPANPWARRVGAAVEATLRDAPPEGQRVPGWWEETPLVALLRRVFGTWVRWSATPPGGIVERVPLDLRRTDTFGSRLIAEVHARYPQGAFDAALGWLLRWERELVWGPVARARSVFRTRLGMPVLLDPYSADRAVRHLVNRGHLTVLDPAHTARSFAGPGHPVPGDLPDEEFARLVIA